jgi:hypothetical protein
MKYFETMQHNFYQHIQPIQDGIERMEFAK